MKRLLVIQNARCEHLGTLQSMFEDDDFEINTMIPGDGDSLPYVTKAYNALVILGGPASVYEEHQYLMDEEKLVKDAIAKSIPTLGVCLGSQIIAKAVGGKVYKGTKKEIGWYPIELTRDGMNSIFKGLKKSIKVFQWHGDTYDLPKNAATLAESKYYQVQAFRVGSAIGVQFHLEVSKDMVMEWISQYRKELESVSNYISRDAITADLDSNADALKEHAKILYKNFSKMVRSSKMVR